MLFRSKEKLTLTDEEILAIGEGQDVEMEGQDKNPKKDDMEVEDNSSPLKKVVEILPKELFRFVGPFLDSKDSKAKKKANNQVRFDKTELTEEEAKTIAAEWDSWSEEKKAQCWKDIEQHAAFIDLIQVKLHKAKKQ